MFMVFCTIMNWCSLVEATKLIGMAMGNDDVSNENKSDLNTTLTPIVASAPFIREVVALTSCQRST